MKSETKMPDMNELLVKSIDSLPPLPQTVSALQKYIDLEGANIELGKVADIISADAIVTAKLLQLANSPYYGFSREITTIQQVINLLGVGNIRNIIIADSIKSHSKVDMTPYKLDTKDFLAKCNAEAAFISAWLLNEDKPLSHFLVPCAMLLRFGMIVFANFLIQNAKAEDFAAALGAANFDVSTVEEDFLGVDHLSFLGFLFHHWNFDETLLESVCFVNSPHSAGDKVKKNAYALAIANYIFAPYNGGSEFAVSSALSLIDEAKSQGISFDRANFIGKLPEFARKNLR